jgi:hypothetical protein
MYGNVMAKPLLCAILYKPRNNFKNKHRITCSNNSTPRYITNRIENRYSDKYMFITSVLAKLWKQYKCPSIDEWISKMWLIHTLGYYSAIR